MADDRPVVVRFRGRVETDTPDSRATYVIIPFDATTTFGKQGRIRVCGTINGAEYRAAIVPYAGHYFFGINARLRASAGVKAGDEVDIAMERDDKPRTIEPPADLAAALQADPAAQAAWDKLSYTHRREYVEWIEEAKKPETRQARIEKTVGQLTQKGKKRHVR